MYYSSSTKVRAIKQKGEKARSTMFPWCEKELIVFSKTGSNYNGRWAAKVTLNNRKGTVTLSNDISIDGSVAESTLVSAYESAIHEAVAVFDQFGGTDLTELQTKKQ